ncbi:MAG: hypothetical protein K2L52_04000 [Clostridia bacterium]|nr:hypothetical protein [Clostridia bacterium]
MKKIVLIITAIVLTCCMISALVACNGTKEPAMDQVEMSYDTSTDYGVYWFGDGNSDYVRSGKNMDTKYFDPSKPTFVFAHGWEPDPSNSTDGFFEDFVTHKETVSYTGVTKRDYAKILKSQGYNVACLSWFSYAKTLGKNFAYIWLNFDNGYALSTRFAMELALVLGEDYQGDVKMVGHSYGSQLALATTYQLVKMQKNKNFSNDHIIPSRLTLADPYFGKSTMITSWQNIKNKNISFTNEPLNSRAPSTLFADITDYVVKNKNIAVDMYFGMSIASTSYYNYDGSDANFEKLSRNSTVVKSEGLKERYGDTSIHNIVRDWVLSSIVDGVLLYDQNGDLAPTGAVSNDKIKAMRGKCYYQTYQGFDLSKDTMQLINRKTQSF